MPILQVEIVGTLAPRMRRGLARRLADAAAEVLGTPPGRTWVRVRRLARADYAENGGPLPRGVRPVFVAVLQARPPRGRRLAQEVAALTAALARACGRPAEHVHLFYEAPAAGRAAFGGRLLTRPAGGRRSRTRTR